MLFVKIVILCNVSKGPVINSGEGDTKREGSQVKFYPYKKGRGRGGKGLSHAEGREGTESLTVVLTQEYEVLAILNGVHKKLSSFKRGVQKVLPCFKCVCVGGGGGCKTFWAGDFPIL